MFISSRTAFIIFVALLFLIIGIGGTLIVIDFSSEIKERIVLRDLATAKKPEASTRNISSAANTAMKARSAADAADATADATDVTALSARKKANKTAIAAKNASDVAEAAESKNTFTKPTI